MKKNSYLCAMKHKGAALNWMHRSLLVFVAAMVLAPQIGFAQEMTRSISGFGTSGTLIYDRVLTDEWLVYNQDGDSSVFGNMNSTGTTFTFAKTGQKMIVKDMGLYSDTVYFCGQMLNAAGTQYNAMMGYFKRSTLPNPTIRYFVVDSLVCLKKLDYYKSYTTKHVTMVGTARNGDDVIVDAFHDFYWQELTPHNWQISWTRVPGVNATIDDIYASTTQACVSMRVPDSSCWYLCRIDLTPLVNVPFFASSALYLRKQVDFPNTPVLLQKGYGCLYAVYSLDQDLRIKQFSGGMATEFCDIPYPRSLSPREPNYFGTLLDVSTDRNYSNLNILVHVIPEGFSVGFNWIYHVPVSLLSTGGNVKYNSYYLNTPLTLCNSANNYTLSIGRSSSNVWSVFETYNNEQEPDCSHPGNATMTTISKREFPLIDKTPIYNTIGKGAVVMPTSHVSVNVSTICQ